MYGVIVLIVRWLLIGALVVGIAGCSYVVATTAYAAINPPPPVANAITIEGPTTVSAGDVIPLQVKFTPPNADRGTIQWDPDPESGQGRDRATFQMPTTPGIHTVYVEAGGLRKGFTINVAALVAGLTVTPFPSPSPSPFVLPATGTPTNIPIPTATATNVPPATAIPPTVAPVSANACRDGEVIGNERNLLDRTPVGLAENNVALEVSWTNPGGEGINAFKRFVLVVPKLEGVYQVFLNNVATIHMTRYCGSLTEVETYLANPSTHVAAMVATAADSAGNTPHPDEIGVYSLSLDGTLKTLRAGPLGPSVAEVRGHIEIVKLGGGVILAASVANQAPAAVATAVPAACPPAQQKTIGWDGANPANVTISGPAIANLGFPRVGPAQYRVYVPTGQTVKFTEVGGAYFQFASTCSDTGLQNQWKDGSLPAWTVQQFRDAGHAQ